MIERTTPSKALLDEIASIIRATAPDNWKVHPVTLTGLDEGKSGVELELTTSPGACFCFVKDPLSLEIVPGSIELHCGSACRSKGAGDNTFFVGAAVESLFHESRKRLLDPEGNSRQNFGEALAQFRTQTYRACARRFRPAGRNAWQKRYLPSI